MGKFVITKRSNEEYQFVLKANNGETVLTSEGYSSKPNCQIGIASVRANAPDDNKYERKLSHNSMYYFNLKASNGQVIGTSEMYQTSVSREVGISSVKNNAPGATIEDLS